MPSSLGVSSLAQNLGVFNIYDHQGFPTHPDYWRKYECSSGGANSNELDSLVSEHLQPSKVHYLLCYHYVRYLN